MLAVMLDRLDETIVAISSAPGYGAVGIVRLSGPGAIGIAEGMASPADHQGLAARPSWSRIAGEVQVDEDTSLPATFYLFRAPRSYTRQDMVEIHTVGSGAVLEMVRQRAVALGAVPAEPGEFTARAFLSGALDLCSAEAVAGVIRARTDTQLRAARRMMDGALAGRLKEARNELAELAALVEADIDFAEEPVEFIAPGALRDRLRGITSTLEALLAESAVVEQFDSLPHILLLGPPNAGKSSLMNRLSGTSRAICAAAAGTTRDILSAPIRLHRTDAILLDAAGVDRSEDELTAEASDRTMSAAQRVDLVCIVVDVSKSANGQVFEAVDALDVGRVVVAANKSDLVSAEEAAGRVKELASRRRGPVCLVSALYGTGLDALRDALREALAVTDTTTTSEAVLISPRQRAAVSNAAEAVGRAVSLSRGARETIDFADLLAVELREALDMLGSVTGEVTTEDLLGQVFANFCIGK